MNLTEEEFWELTPRKFFALVSCAIEFTKLQNGGGGGSKGKPPAPIGHIDNIKGW